MPFFSCFRHWTAKQEITDSWAWPSFSLGYRTFLVLLFYDNVWKLGDCTENSDFPNFLDHETFHSNTRSTFLPGNNLLDLSRDSNFREYTHSPVDPSPHHSPHAFFKPHYSFIYNAWLRQQFHCRFSTLRQQRAKLQELLKHSLEPDRWLALTQHCEFSHLNHSISVHPLYHPCFSEQICMEILPLLWAENFNWSQNSISWN